MAGAAACPGDDVGDSESDGAALFSFLQIVFVFVAFNYDSSGSSAAVAAAGTAIVDF